MKRCSPVLYTEHGRFIPSDLRDGENEDVEGREGGKKKEREKERKGVVVVVVVVGWL